MDEHVAQACCGVAREAAEASTVECSWRTTGSAQLAFDAAPVERGRRHEAEKAQVQPAHRVGLYPLADGDRLGVGQGARGTLVQGDGADQRTLSQHGAAPVEVRDVDGVRSRQFDEIRDRRHRVERRAPFREDPDVEITRVGLASPGTAEDGQHPYAMTRSEGVQPPGGGRITQSPQAFGRGGHEVIVARQHTFRRSGAPAAGPRRGRPGPPSRGRGADRPPRPGRGCAPSRPPARRRSPRRRRAAPGRGR